LRKTILTTGFPLKINLEASRGTMLGYAEEDETADTFPEEAEGSKTYPFSRRPVG
jgi:hypothetical protein